MSHKDAKGQPKSLGIERKNPKCFCGHEFQNIFGYRPYLLPCSHILCQSCLLKKKIICHKCGPNSAENYSNLNTSNLETAYYVHGIVTSLNSLDADQHSSKTHESAKLVPNDDQIIKQKTHDICYECNKETTTKCKECSALLCQKCFQDTHRAKIFATHTLFHATSTSLLANGICLLHNNQRLQYFCNDCCKEMCTECRLFHRKEEHNVESITISNESKVTSAQLNDFKRYIADIEDQIEKSVKALDATELIIKAYAREAVDTISNAFIGLHCLLQNKEKDIWDRINDYVSKMSEHVTTSRTILNETEAEAKHADQTIRSLEKQAPDNISIKHFVKNAYKSLDNLPCLIQDEQLENPFRLNPQEYIDGIIQHVDRELNPHFGCFRQPQFRTMSSKDVTAMNDSQELSQRNHLSTQYQQVVQLSSRSPNANVSKMNPSPRLAHMSPLDSPFPENGNNLPSKFMCNFDATIDKIRSKNSPPKLKRNHSTRNVELSQVFTNQSMSFVQKTTQIGTVKVYVSAVHSPSSFYIQKRCFFDDESYNQKLFNDCGENPQNHPPYQSSIDPNKIFLVQIPDDNNWYRAKVLDIGSKKKERLVLLLDYGRHLKLNISNFRLLGPELRKKANGAIHCAFYDLRPIEKDWTEEAIVFLNNLILNKRLTAIFSDYKKNQPQDVDLIMCQDSFTFSVRYALIATNFAAESFEIRKCLENMSFSKQRANLIINDPRIIAPHEFMESDTFDVKVTHVISLSEFYAMRSIDIQPIRLNNEKLNEKFENPKEGHILYVPRMEMMCAAFAKNKWHRGRVVKILGKGLYAIFFIDIGETKALCWKDLRLLNDEFFQMNDGVSKFSLFEIIPKDGSNVFSDESIKTFKHLCTDATLTVKINREIGASYAVTLTATTTTDKKQICINTFMVAKGYAIAQQNNFVPNGQKSVCDESEDSFAPNFPANSKSINMPKKEIRFNVKMMYVVSPSEFYVMLKSRCDEINTLQAELQDFILLTQYEMPPKIDWKVRDHCLISTHLVNDDHNILWYRGIIVEIKEKKCSVFLQDVGATIKASFPEDLAIIDKSKDTIGGAAIKCNLAFVDPTNNNKWSLTAIDKFREICTLYEELSITMPDVRSNSASLTVLLWGLETHEISALEPTVVEWRNLNMYLVYQGLAHLTIQFDEIANCQLKSHLDTGTNLHVVNEIILQLNGSHRSSCTELRNDVQKEVNHWIPANPITKKTFSCIPTQVDRDLNIYVHEEEQEEFLKAMSEKINEKLLNNPTSSSSSSSSSITWQPKQACMAKYKDGRFYRGEIIMVNALIQKCLVRFVDYGNEEPVPFYDLSKIAIFGDVPIQATKYRLINIRPASEDGEWPEEVIELCFDEIVDKVCTIRVHENYTDQAADIPLPCSISANGSIDLRSILLSHNLAKKDVFKNSLYAEREASKFMAKRQPDKTNNLIEINTELLCDVEDYKKVYEATRIDDHLDMLDNSSTSKEDDERQLDQFDTIKRFERFDLMSLSISTQFDDNIQPSHPIVDLIRKYFHFFPIVEDTSELPCQILLVVDPLMVLIAPISSEYNSEYNEAKLQLQKDVKHLKLLKKFNLHSPCIAYSEEERAYLRGIVYGDETPAGEYEILFVDSLKRSMVKKSRIHMCISAWFELPLCYTKVKLHGLRANNRLREADIVDRLTIQLIEKCPMATAKVIRLGKIPSVKLTERNNSKVTLYSGLVRDGYYTKVREPAN